jgi:hypothetical protein
MRDFESRLQESSFDEDALVGVFTARPGDSVETAPALLESPSAVWLPERLVSRLALIGQGYELHVLPRFLKSTGRLELNHSQLEAAETELDFVISVVRDEALAALAGKLIASAQATRSQPGAVLLVEFP